MAMDHIMQDDQPSTSRRRKRSSAWMDDDTVALDDAGLPEVEHTPSKRLLNARGEAIQTSRVMKYNARKLLNHLAFTQVYVTANFANYNPNSSCVILCMAARQNEMYQMLRQRLPSLYDVAPNLQALAIADDLLDANAIPNQSLLRKLPFVTTAGMEVSVVEEFRAFHQDVSNNEDCIAVVDPRGVCVWHSAERTAGAIAAALDELRNTIVGMSPTVGSRDVDMDEG